MFSSDVDAWRSMTLLLNSKKRRRFLIDPRVSTRLAWWDSVGGAILVFTAIVTPFEVAFLPPDDSALTSRFIINRMVDVFFLCDMLLQLMIMYPNEKHISALPRNLEAEGSFRGRADLQGAATEATSERPEFSRTEARGRTEMITNHRLIAWRYLRTWFAIDLVSVLTCLIDIIPLLINSDANTNEDAIDSLRILRVVRVLRTLSTARACGVALGHILP